MFPHLCSPLNCCMKMFNHCDNKISSEHNPMQSHACSCNNLSCLPSFDIIFEYIHTYTYIYIYIYIYKILYKTLKFFLLLIYYKRLKDTAVCMKQWIPPMSCNFRLTKHSCTPTYRTNVYHNWFHDYGT